jgi:hypothetical protein
VTEVFVSPCAPVSFGFWLLSPTGAAMLPAPLAIAQQMLARRVELSSTLHLGTKTAPPVDYENRLKALYT